MFEQMKELFQLQNKMQKMRKELEEEVFEVASADGRVKVVMTGAQQVKGVYLQEDIQGLDKSKLEMALKEAYAKAIERSHNLAEQKMKGMLGFNLPFGLR